MTDEQPHEPGSMMKKELRLRLRKIMAGLTAEDLHHRSLQACDRLTETDVYRAAEVIMVFLSLPTEVDTTPLVLQSWRDRKRVLAPKVSWEQRRMLPIEVRSLSDGLEETRLGLREPAQGVPFPLDQIDVVIVPGLGFDVSGNRIGRGRGFYDRFLAQSEWHGVSCGLALEVQVVEHVPTGEQDMRIDMLVTDAAVRHFDAAHSGG